jgi:hypothetical protein
MATKSKFRKLILGPSDPITRRNSVQGMFVVGDYIDPLNRQRVLLLERPELASDGTTAKPVIKRKRAAKVATPQPTNAGSQTAFPGAGVTNGA